MSNIHFASIAQNTDTTVNLLVFDGDKIIDRQEGLHDHWASDHWVKEHYGMNLEIGECFASHNAFRASRYGKMMRG